MITIAWDVDDVLNNLMQSWFEKQWLATHEDCALRYTDIAENPPHKLLGVSIDDYLSSLDAFRLSGAFQDMEPVPEVKDWFFRYGSRARHIALTAVPLSASPVSAAWVLRHFGMWIRTYHFIPSRRRGQDLPEYDSGKEGFLKWLGKIDIMVDDNESNVIGAERAGVRSMLMPQRWNRSNSSIEEILADLTRILQKAECK